MSRPGLVSQRGNTPQDALRGFQPIQPQRGVGGATSAAVQSMTLAAFCAVAVLTVVVERAEPHEFGRVSPWCCRTRRSARWSATCPQRKARSIERRKPCRSPELLAERAVDLANNPPACPLPTRALAVVFLGIRHRPGYRSARSLPGSRSRTRIHGRCARCPSSRGNVVGVIVAHGRPCGAMTGGFLPLRNRAGWRHRRWWATNLLPWECAP